VANEGAVVERDRASVVKLLARRGTDTIFQDSATVHKIYYYVVVVVCLFDYSCVVVGW
jgi:hypothetical protein